MDSLLLFWICVYAPGNKIVLNGKYANGVLFALIFVILSCLVSVMVMYVSGGLGGTDLQAMLQLQIGATIVAIGLIAGAVWAQGRKENSGNYRHAVRVLWRATPVPLIIGLIVLNSLVFVGELSFFLVATLMHEPIHWSSHMVLICMFTCSVAFVFVYAGRNPGAGDSSSSGGRW